MFGLANLAFFLHFFWVLTQSSVVHEVLHSPAFFFSLHFEADHISTHAVVVVVVVVVVLFVVVFVVVGGVVVAEKKRFSCIFSKTFIQGRRKV